jgi:hypothetical protein
LTYMMGAAIDGAAAKRIARKATVEAERMLN